MKIFILALLVHGIGSCTLMASNWMPISKIQSGSIEGYQLESECLKKQEQCLDIGDEPIAVEKGYFILSDELVDDLTSPIWGSRSMVESCADEIDCKAIHEIKQCTDGRESYYSSEDLEVWCNKIIGYHKVSSGKKAITIDQAALSNYHASLAAQAQVNDLILQGSRARSDCQKVLDLIGGFNLLPGRTSEQAGEMVLTFSAAKEALQDGRPGAAKAAIQAIPVDGVLVTQNMKDLALSILKDWQ